MTTPTTGMPLGNFSVSLSVQNLEASMAFYQKLGFEPIHGDIERNWIIVRNANATIGLFQGMFPRNTLTFNPGWDNQGGRLADFTDVRELEQTADACRDRPRDVDRFRRRSRELHGDRP